jgi:hypothetical protein
MHTVFAFGGLLVWNSQVTEFSELRIIPLELITVSEITNIKPVRKKPEEDIPPEVTEPAEDVPPELPTESEDGELLADTPPEETPNVEPEAEQQAAFNLDDFSKMVDQARKDNPNANTQTVLKSEIGDREIIGAGQEDGMTLNYQEYIQTKMAGCWKIDSGAKDYRNLRVEVRVMLNKDGAVQDIAVLNNMRIIASPNDSWRAARDNVIFAINQCAPYDKLPNSDYSTWKTTKMTFQPPQEG